MGAAFQVTLVEVRLRQDRTDQGLVFRFATVGGATQRQLLLGQSEPLGHLIVDQRDGLKRFGRRSMENDALGVSHACGKAPLRVHHRDMHSVGRLHQPRSLDDHTAHRRTLEPC